MRGEQLSNRQVTASLETIEKETEYLATKAEEEANALPAPLGRQTFEGIIVKVSVKEGFRGQQEIKLVVAHSDGWACYVSAPYELYRKFRAANLVREASYSNGMEISQYVIGSKVSLKATLSASNKPTFAWGKRPVLLEWQPKE